MQNRKVCVIVPVYNVLPYVERCLNSLIKQTYKNLEIIVVDDGSNDGSEKVCDRLAETHKNVKVFHKTNGGLSSARNYGLQFATGEYVAFVDSDDYVQPNMFEKMLQALNNSNSDMCVCSFVRKQNGSQKHVLVENAVVSSLDYYKLFAKKESMPYVVVWNKLYKTSLFNGLKFPENKIHEDQWIMHRVLNNAERTCLISDELYNYTDRANGLSKGKNFASHFDDFDAVFDRINFLKEINHGELLKYCEEHLFNLGAFYLSEMYSYKILNKTLKQFKGYLKKCLGFSKECLKQGYISKKTFVSRQKTLGFGIVHTIKFKIKNKLEKSKKQI